MQLPCRPFRPPIGAVKPADKRQCIEELARAQGFDLVGFAAPHALERAGYYREWLAAGRAGSMAYLHRYPAQRTDATVLLPGARTVIVCALNYHQRLPDQGPAGDAARGRVAMYAWGDDYHKVVKRKLFRVADGMRAAFAEPFEAQVCVDTAPLLEREYAMRAGVGWIGKNTMVMNSRLGSFFFLGEIVTTLALPHDAPALDHCGTCTRCLDACPTQAFPAPYQMDATRCISYLTIENRADQLPADLARDMGDWVFGCDVCQTVCPHNRAAPETGEPRFTTRAPGPAPRLDEMIAWTDAQYREILAGSAVKRAKPTMLRRNARNALANGARAGSSADRDPPPRAS